MVLRKFVNSQISCQRVARIPDSGTKNILSETQEWLFDIFIDINLGGSRLYGDIRFVCLSGH